MSSLESKIEYNSSNDELQDDYIKCFICNEVITKDTYKRMSVKPKGKKSYSRYDICTTCQNKTHLCPNNCGTPLSAATWIKGHHKTLCDREYRKSHPHTDKDAKIAELQNQLETITTDRNYLSREYDSLKEKCKRYYDVIEKLKTYIQSDLHPRLAQMSLSTCTHCYECEQHTVDKHNCTKCRPCDNCKNTVKIINDELYMNDKKFKNILHS